MLATASMHGEGPAGIALSGRSQPAPGQRARKGSTGACDPDGPAQRGRTSVDMGLAVHDSTVGGESLAGIASPGHRRKSAGMRGHDRPEPRHRQRPVRSRSARSAAHAPAGSRGQAPPARRPLRLHGRAGARGSGAVIVGRAGLAEPTGLGDGIRVESHGPAQFKSSQLERFYSVPSGQRP